MNPVVHFELPYQDAERARTFYANVFGWQIADWPLIDGTSYVGVMTAEMGEDKKPLEKGTIGGGMVEKAMLEHPTILIKTENAQAAAEKAIQAGAEQISEHSYADVGKVIYIKDTEGNIVGIWEEFKKD